MRMSRWIRRASHADSIAPIPVQGSPRCPRTRCRTCSAGRRARCRFSSPRTPRGRSTKAAISSSSCTWCRALAPRPCSRRSGSSSPRPSRRVCRSSSSSNRRPSTSPPAPSNHVVEDSYVLPADVSVVSVYPHAHYLAREMSGTATLPDGTVTPLLSHQAWDIRWQDQYRYREPLTAAEGDDAADAIHLRQLRRQSAQSETGASRGVGPELDRRNGRAVGGGDSPEARRCRRPHPRLRPPRAAGRCGQRRAARAHERRRRSSAERTGHAVRACRQAG